MFIKDKNEPLIIYKDFFDKSREDKLITYLQNEIKWGQDKYTFYDKEVLSPRLTFFFGNRPYNYSGQTKNPTPFNKPIQYLANLIEDKLEIEKGYFNGCLLNWYRDGKDSISYHSDNEPDMIKEAIIAVISVGAERKFYIKNNKTKEVSKNILSSCSLAVMNPICQDFYQHSIPKELKIKDSRISLTFRRFKD